MMYGVNNRKELLNVKNYLDYEGNLKIKAKQIYLFPILPSVTWNFKF